MKCASERHVAHCPLDHDCSGTFASFRCRCAGFRGHTHSRRNLGACPRGRALSLAGSIMVRRRASRSCRSAASSSRGRFTVATRRISPRSRRFTRTSRRVDLARPRKPWRSLRWTSTPGSRSASRRRFTPTLTARPLSRTSPRHLPRQAMTSKLPVRSRGHLSTAPTCRRSVGG